MNDSMKPIATITAILFVSMLQCHASKYWVRPNTTVVCPPGTTTESCVTLSDIATNNSMYFNSNTEIHFLTGVHYITAQTNMWIGVSERTAVSNVSLIGKNTTKLTDCSYNIKPLSDCYSNSAIINCNGTNLGLIFNGVKNLSISGLEITHCGVNITEMSLSQAYHLTLQKSVFASLFLFHVNNSLVKEITIKHSKGFGLLVIDSTNVLEITKCTLKYNNVSPNNSNITEFHSPGGNAYITATATLSNYHYRLNIYISKSVFAHTVSSINLKHKTAVFSTNNSNTFSVDASPFSMTQSAGLSFDLHYISANVTISNCTFTNNTAVYGGNMLATATRDLLLNVNYCIFSSGKATNSGGGVHITFTTFRSTQYVRSIVTFSNTLFEANTAIHYGGGLVIKYYVKAVSNVQIEKCNFINNNAILGGAVYNVLEHVYLLGIMKFTIIQSMFYGNYASQFGGAIFSTCAEEAKNRIRYQYRIQQSSFFGNRAELGSAMSLYNLEKSGLPNEHHVEINTCTFNEHSTHKSKSGSVLHLNEIDSILITDTSIINNKCRGIHVNMTSIEIGRNVWIVNNTAKEGGGIFFDCYLPSIKYTSMSYMLINNNSVLTIKDNHAEKYGGGIMFESGCNDRIIELCFFQVSRNYNESQRTVVLMSGNTAGIAGTSIYGGNLEYCYVRADDAPLIPALFWSMFNINENDLGPSAVTSRPYKVCICIGNFTTKHSCAFEYSTKVYPGQTFRVPAVGVGQYNYSSPSVIRATILNGHNVQIEEQQVTQDINLICKNLTYSLNTLEASNSVTIQLSIETPLSSETTLPELQPATLTVRVLNCPLGFELYKDPKTCDCLSNLAKSGVTCNILDQTVHRSRTMWIGNFSGDIVVHQNCPYDYCDQNVTDFSLESQKEQCNFNRTGILCGACQSGHSLALGTSRCMECSNVYLLLLIPFLFAGFALVLLLLKCNLTVSTGTINGLIFYANIIQVNNKVLLPSESTSPNGLLITSGRSIPQIGYIISIFIAWMNMDFGIEVCFTESLDTFTRTWLQFLFPIYIWLIVAFLILLCRYSTTVSRLIGSNIVSVLATLFLLSYAKLLRTTLNVFSPITIIDNNDTAHLRWLLDGNYGYLECPHMALFLVGLLMLVTHLIPFTALILFGPTLQAYTNYRVLGWVTRFKPFLDAYQGPYKTKYRYWTGLMLLVRVFLYTVFAGNSLGNPNVNILTISLTVSVLLIVWVKIGRVYRKSPLNGLELFYLLNLLITNIVTLYLRATSENNAQQHILYLIAVGSALIVFFSILVYHGYSEIAKTNNGKKLKRKFQVFWTSRKCGAIKKEIAEHEGMNKPHVRVKSPTRTVVCLQQLEQPLLDD